jgi:hypothetical protein
VASFSILLDRTNLNLEASVSVSANGATRLFAPSAAKSLQIKVEELSQSPKDTAVPGPISDAFAAPFLAVIGTKGQEAVQAEAQAREFLNSWHKRFFTTPRSKVDTDLNDDDLRDYNLVLFGTTESNEIIARIAQRLPVHYSSAGLSVGSRSWQGRGYSIQAVFPNPLHPTHYVVLAGDPECGKCFSDAVQFTLHAWYDAVIWQRRDDGYVQMADVGFFDRSWREFIPVQACH